MNAYLLDTHILLWAASGSPRLSDRAKSLIQEPATEIFFSVVSLWEVAIKTSRGRADFSVDVARFRNELLGAGFRELPLRGLHVLELRKLPALHADPFDRLLLAQASGEAVGLLTNDKLVLDYGEPAEPA